MHASASIEQDSLDHANESTLSLARYLQLTSDPKDESTSPL
jgi:hypothetical protein